MKKALRICFSGFVSSLLQIAFCQNVSKILKDAIGMQEVYWVTQIHWIYIGEIQDIKICRRCIWDPYDTLDLEKISILFVYNLMVDNSVGYEMSSC